MADTPDYSKRQFLIVDDEPFMLSMLDRVLKNLKATRIIKARDGAEAIKCIRDDMGRVDCIISDFNMKPVNGLQLLQGIRMGVNPRIPRDQAFIMVTGHGETEVVKTAVMLDVNGYLVKPVSPEKLAQALERAFKKGIQARDVDYYRAINAGAPRNEAAKGSVAWTVLSDEALHRRPGLKDKVAQFQSENATRDGVEAVKIKSKRQCDLAELREDMILAEDIEAAEGIVLLRTGTRLTAPMVERLREFAIEGGERSFIWVGELA